MYTKRILYIKYIIYKRCLKEGIKNIFDIVGIALEYNTLKSIDEEQFKKLVNEIYEEVMYYNHLKRLEL